MTFTHLMNCAALTYGPIYMVYSGANLSEYRIFYFSWWSIIYYTLSSLIKMVLYATVIPYHMIESEGNIITQVYLFLTKDILKITINLIELLFLSYSLRAKNSFTTKETSSKILAVALSWALADSVASNLLYFLMEATGEEFKWDFIQAAIQSNFDLLERIASVSLMSCCEKLRTAGMWNFHIFFILIIKFFASGLLFKYTPFLQFENSWDSLICKGGFALTYAIIAKIVYSKVQSDLSDFEEENLINKKKK